MARGCLPREDLENLEIDPLGQNPKGQLQELLQAISPGSPVYPILAAEGPEHRKQFVARVSWHGLHLGEGVGRSKKDAETHAATDALLKRLWLTPSAPALPASENFANIPPTTANDSR